MLPAQPAPPHFGVALSPSGLEAGQSFFVWLVFVLLFTAAWLLRLFSAVPVPRRGKTLILIGCKSGADVTTELSAGSDPIRGM